jgi:hypothetical protein
VAFLGRRALNLRCIELINQVSFELLGAENLGGRKRKRKRKRKKKKKGNGIGKS